MAKKYIWQYPAWPNLQWDEQALAPLITQCRKKQHFLLGAVSVLGFDLRLQAQGIILEKEVIETSAIEGEQLDPEGVRSSVANKLGLATAGSRPADRKTDATVEVLLDAAKHFNTALSQERLKGWHAALFPDGYSGFHRIVTGDWRQQEMEIVSGPEGRQQVHYKAPPPEAVPEEIGSFLHWLNDHTSSPSTIDGLIRAALAHYRFVAIHPFDDGNGRIARALTDMALAQDENSATRFYSLSHRIMQDRDAYYAVLERCSNGSGDVTPWLEWFLQSFKQAVISSRQLINRVLVKAGFWQEFAGTELNPRQKKVVNTLLDAGKGNFEGYLAARKYRSLAKTTKATASRDLEDLIKKGILKRLEGGGRSSKYDLTWERFEPGHVMEEK
ncbi:MAG: Fic family protein [Candidatus Electrothrix sp. AR5]|nr:Fic family protein [Candidatus Electrothrix sp. AR5]